MKVILCIDDNGGMLFNHRRVSSDRAVTEKVIEISGSALSVTEFSRKLFPNARIITEEQIPELKCDDYFFLENVRLAPVLENVSELILFRWNRRYPSDFGLDVVPEKLFTLEGSVEFAGNSHEKIIMEVWKK